MALKVTDIIDSADATIPTWLTIGAVIHLLAQAIFPIRILYSTLALYIVYRLIVVVRDSRSIYSTSFTNVKPGRWFVDLPEAEKVPELDVPSDGIVCFVLGARFNQ